DLLDVALDPAVGGGQALLADHRDPHAGLRWRTGSAWKVVPAPGAGAIRRVAAASCPARWPSAASNATPSRSPIVPHANAASAAGGASPRAAHPAGRPRSASANASGSATVRYGTSGANPRVPCGVVMTASPAASVVGS